MLMYGGNANVMREMCGIEQECTVIPAVCVKCDVCHKYSLISHSLACHLHREQAEKDAMSHYANICALHTRMIRNRKVFLA